MTAAARDVADAPTVTVTGTWQKHCAVAYRASALAGRSAYGRWGTSQGFPVLYLGRPEESVVAEAYRHIVDPVLDAPELLKHLAPRAVVTCTVDVPDVLDLREPIARSATGLSIDVLQSATHDRAAYQQCQEVASVAHQLGLRGVITPAATKLGETLALFTNRLTPDQRPIRTADDAIWSSWPADPRQQRRLSAVPDEE